MVMGELAESKEVVVIGAGPGGYTAAIRCAQLGKEVVLIEKGGIGGVCLNEGCIPSKTLIHSANLAQKMREAGIFGISSGKIKINHAKMRSQKDKVVEHLSSSVENLLKENGVQILRGEARFETASRLHVVLAKEGGSRIFQFGKCIIATGSSPASIDGFEINGKNIWDSTRALQLPKIPKRLLIIGGGYVGLELGGVYQKLGSKVTIVQRTERLMAQFSEDAVFVVQKNMESLGTEFLTNAEVTGCSKRGAETVVTLKVNKKTKKIACDAVLVAVGRTPNVKTLGLENTTIKINERGLILTNDKMQTTEENIYAIGDVRGEPMLAHKAMREAYVAAESVCGKASGFDSVIPAVVFTDPEIASCGISAKDAAAKGMEIITGRFSYSNLGRAMTTNATKGFAEVVCDKKSYRILGVEIVGEHASDLISEAVLAMEMGAVAQDIALTIHPHPTFSEILREACQCALGESVHQIRK